jgi:hypothetical protein
MWRLRRVGGWRLRRGRLRRGWRLRREEGEVHEVGGGWVEPYKI